jgi:2',3'-cyclic-nucleotide 2'-phosphodiesterase (5'-nucleotidase family)
LASPDKSPVASPAVTLSPASFQLTVLHTNDTWGYLFPCG